MNREEFVQYFKDTLDYMYSTMDKKNHDYAGDTDPFANFKLTETLGITSVERGILVRMSDKVSRIVNLIDKENKVSDEKITDTLIDLANYSIILSAYIKSIK